MTETRERIVEEQLRRLNAPGSGLSLLREKNPFYRNKLDGIPLPVPSLADFRGLPFTTKKELLQDQSENPPWGTNLTRPAADYTRIHATSGTTGRSLKVLDTQESWGWFTECWRRIYRAFGVGPEDRVFVAFGFGPFLGFWAGFEAAHQLGALAVPGGGQSSLQRLHAILECDATVLVSTPTYALRLAEVAKENGLDIRASSVRTTVHAGEPGASIPATRKQIENAWGARAWDHAGLSEAGAWGYECSAGGGLHVIDSEFIAEVLTVEEDRAVDEDAVGELVLTNLGRWDAPVLRYRTGDLVRLRSEPCACGRASLRFPGGVLGRADDMIAVRGVNVYPGAVETIVREQESVVEFQVEVFENRRMWEMRVDVELAPEVEAERVRALIESEIQRRIGLRTTVALRPLGSLPRFELKARRFRIRTEDHKMK
jgi:phenylacetate-CoA ligase